jgi:N-methylhydantoinase A
VVRRAAAKNGARPKLPDRDVYWEELSGRVPTAVWDGSLLEYGTHVDGPAVIELPDTTIAVRPAQRAAIDEYGNAVVSLGGPT